MTIRDIAIAFGFRVDEQSVNNAENAVQNLKNTATKLLGAIGIGISVAGVASALKNFVALSSEAEEMQNKFDVVFQGMTEDVEAWAQSYADAIGRNSNDIKTYLADQQNLLVGFGMARDEGAKLSEQMTSLALDLASFGNLDETMAVNNMTKAVMGESEAAKSLGAVLNDSTREQAMLALGLSGTYDALDQLTKMQVNYQAILGQSGDAIGDCERSLGSYASTVKSFQAKLKEVKTIVGQFFMPTFQKALSYGSRGLTMLRDGVRRFSDFADKIGGAHRILTVLAVTIASVIAVMNFKRIQSGLSMISKLLLKIKLETIAIIAVIIALVLLVDDFITFMKGDNSVIGRLFEKAGISAENARETILSVWKTVTGFLTKTWETIIQIGERIWGALGRFWEDNGESILTTLSEVWGAVLAVVSAIWVALKEIAHTIFDGLRAFWNDWGDTIKKLFSILWKYCGEQIMAFLKIVKGLAQFVSGVLSGDWSKAWEGIENIVVGVFDRLLSFINNVWSAILVVFTGSAGDAEGRMAKMRNFLAGVWQGIKATATAIFNALKAFWDRWGAQILTQFRITWDTISGIFSAFLQVAQGVINFITGIFTGNWEQAWQGVKGIFEGIWNAISTAFMAIWNTIHNWFGGKIAAVKETLVETFNSAIEFMKSLPGQALQWGKDFIDGLVNGIKEKAFAVVDAVKGIGEDIKSFLHFSAPDEGPLADYEAWMPDFMSGLARGIRDNKSKVIDAIKALTQDLSVAGDVAVRGSTAAAAAGGGNRTTNVNQTNNIKNEFHGGERSAQTEGAKAMSKSAEDATDYMARGLAYGR